MPHNQDREDPKTERLMRITFRWLWLGLGLLMLGMALRLALPVKYFPALIGLFAVAFIALLYATSRIADAEAKADPRHHRELLQRRWVGFVVLVLFLSFMGAADLARLSFPPDDVLRWCLDTLQMLPAPLFFILGPGKKYNEEITLALRDRAMRVGYITALVVLVTAMFVAMIRPAALMPTLAWGLFAGIAIPIFTYVILDWLSDRGTDG